MKNKRHAVRALSLAAFAAVPSLAARGQTWVPTSGVSNWSVGSNWDTGTVPVSGTNTVLVFGGAGGGYTAFNDVADPFNLNKLNITSTATGPVIIGATSTASVGTATFQFGGTAPTVNHTGSADAFLTGDVNVGTVGATFNVAGPGRVIMLGDVANTTGGITKTGAGTLVWGWEGAINPNVSGRGINVSLTGEVKVLEGTIQIGSVDGSFLSNGSLLTVASGATFDFHGNAEDFGSIQGQGTIQTNGADMRIGLDNRSTTWEGSILGTSASAVINKGGTGTFTVSTPQGYWGVTTVSEGSLVLNKSGALTRSSEATVDSGAKLVLDNTAQNVFDRIRDGEDVAGLTLNGNSELVMLGNASAPSAEGISPLFIRGFATVTLVPGAGQTASIDSIGLERLAGGIVLFRGTNLGGTGANSSKVTFQVTPPLVGGGGAVGTTAQSILPYALGDTSATGTGNSLVTYDPSRGIRPLDVTEYAAYGTATAVENVRIAGGATGLAGKTVNALVVDNSTAAATAVTGTGTLTPTSGAVLFTGAQPITLSGFDALAFGGAEGIVSVANTSAGGVTIANPITGTAGLFKGGAGVLVLNAANAYSGHTTINGGTVRISADNNLGAGGNQIRFNNGTLQLTANLTTSRGVVSNDGGVGILDTNGFTLDYRGTFSGAGAIVKTGAGTLLLPEYGTGNAITFNGGIIRPTRNATSGTNGRGFILQGSPTAPINTFDTNGFDSVLGAVSGAGGMIKTGAGTMLMQGSNTFDGDITISQGTVKIIGTGGSFFEDSTYSNIAAGATLDMSDNPEQWGGISGAGTIFTGNAAGVDVNVVGSRNATFSGVINGGGNFVKNGTATVTLSGASGYTGTTAVNNGILVVTGNAPSGAAGTLGNSTGAVLLGNTSGSTAAQLLIGAANVTVGRNITLRAGGTLTLGSNHATGVSTFSGNVPLTKALTLTAAAGGQTDFTGVLSGTGALTKAGAGVVRLTNANTYSGATTVSAGTLRIDGSATNSASLTVNGGTFEAGSTQTLKALTVNNGGLAKINGTSVLTTKALTMGTSTARVDVGAGTLVFDYTGANPVATVRQALVNGRGATGAWNGTLGITSSAITDANRAVGYGEATTLVGPAGGTWNGITLDADAIVMRMTLSGDANLDTRVNFNDLLALARNYNQTSRGWTEGDFTYDGTVNFNDLLALARSYNQALPAPTGAEMATAGMSATFQADVASAFAAVPEPGTAGLALAACGMALSARRRRRM